MFRDLSEKRENQKEKLKTGKHGSATSVTHRALQNSLRSAPCVTPVARGAPHLCRERLTSDFGRTNATPSYLL